MKVISFYLIFWTTISFGQNLDTIKKIEISYGYGAQCFPKNGVYSRSERFTFEKSETEGFYLTRYKKYWSEYRKRGNVFKKDSLINVINKKIDKNLILELITNLNATNYNDYTIAILKSKLKAPTKKQIIKLSRKSDLYYKIECDGLFDCEYRNEEIDSIISLENFNVFLPSFNMSTDEVITIGYSDNAQVTLQSEKNITIYRFSFTSNKIGQPFIKTYKNNHTQSNSILNLKVNEIIRELTPAKSLTFKAFDFNKITDDYIYWYLEKY
jgi:hypothetical protein